MSRPRRPRPSPTALRLCHAVGLATRVHVGRWIAIRDVLAHLPAGDRAGLDAVIAAAVSAGLVEINPGAEAHSVKLTAAGLDACRAAAALPGGRRASRTRA